MAVSYVNFGEKHAVAGSSRLKATKTGHIFDIQVTDETLDNGTVIGRGEFVGGQIYKQAAASEAFTGKVIGTAANGNYYVEVTAVTPAQDLLVIQVPETPYDYTSQMKHESYFYNEKDDIVRAYELYVGDVFELSAEGFTDTFAVKDDVSVDATTKKLKKK